jgi:hypothetical protein
MKTLFIILFCSIALFAQDSTLIELDSRINFCDSLYKLHINEIIETPVTPGLNSEQIRILILRAREWAIRKDIYEESKKVYLLKNNVNKK